MSNLRRFQSEDLSSLMDKIVRNSIGLDSYIDDFWTNTTSSNYPPYNLVQVNNVESRLEIALAGFKKKEVKVYTEFGKLHVEGIKEDKETDATYQHRGLAQRSFKRSWQLSEDCEVRQVVFEDGLLSVELGKVVPEHHTRKDYMTGD